jgi:MFS family permease
MVVAKIEQSSILGAVNALFYTGAAFGSIAQGFIADKVGRKKALAISAVSGLVGGALSAGSVNVPMLVTVRLLQGLGLGMLIVLVPLYITEVAPPRYRGLLAGITPISFGLGYFMSAPYHTLRVEIHDLTTR